MCGMNPGLAAFIPGPFWTFGGSALVRRKALAAAGSRGPALDAAASEPGANGSSPGTCCSSGTGSVGPFPTARSITGATASITPTTGVATAPGSSLMTACGISANCVGASETAGNGTAGTAGTEGTAGATVRAGVGVGIGIGAGATIRAGVGIGAGATVGAGVGASETAGSETAGNGTVGTADVEGSAGTGGKRSLACDGPASHTDHTNAPRRARRAERRREMAPCPKYLAKTLTSPARRLDVKLRRSSSAVHRNWVDPWVELLTFSQTAGMHGPVSAGGHGAVPIGTAST